VYCTTAKRTEAWPQGTCKSNMVKIGPVVPEICARTDTHTQTHRQTDRCTDRWIDHNTPHPDLGGVKSVGLKGLTERQPHTQLEHQPTNQRETLCMCEAIVTIGYRVVAAGMTSSSVRCRPNYTVFCRWGVLWETQATKTLTTASQSLNPQHTSFTDILGLPKN